MRRRKPSQDSTSRSLVPFLASDNLINHGRRYATHHLDTGEIGERLENGGYIGGTRIGLSVSRRAFMSSRFEKVIKATRFETPKPYRANERLSIFEPKWIFKLDS